jgi:polysaccharide deacetylase 2 family uncharacterized protein YibQ
VTSRTIRRSRGSSTSPRTIVLLFAAAAALVAGGFATLYARSEDGQIARARMGFPADRTVLTRTLSKTIKQTFADAGVEPGAQVIQTREKVSPRVLWTAQLTARSSPLQLNARLTTALEERGAAVIDAWEDTLAAPGSEVHLLVGAGRTATHEIVLARRVGAGGEAKKEEIARLFLVVDGFAHESTDSLARVLVKLGVPFTGAVLPEYPGTREWANLLAQTGNEVLVQLPMEPLNYPQRDPGPGALLVDMTSGQIQRLVKKHLGAVPHAAGATSWMGAMALGDREVLDAMMAELKRANAYYLDARTVTGSLAAERAAEAGVVCLRVDQRLEAPGKRDAQAKAMARQLGAVVDLARRRGYAIVLVHPEKATLDVLGREIPKLRRSGVRFERLSTLLEPQGA